MHRFAARLDELWLAAGKPPYRHLEKLDPQLPKSTISDVLRGKTAPSDRFVRAFVRACRRYSQKNGWPAVASIFDERALLEAWLQLQRDLRDLRRHRPRPAPAPPRRPADEPVHGRYGAACAIGCTAVDADVVAVRRVLDALRRMNTA